MQQVPRLEAALRATLDAFHGRRPPSPLGEAMAYAIFPAGARLRPTLALAVAAAHADGPMRVLPCAVALELLHGASLVHDDLPCFDDAALRRHKPSAHCAYGEATAVLAGDALLALAFRAVGDLAEPFDAVRQRLLAEAATCLMHGQAQEQQGEGNDAAALAAYHDGKTGSLFEAAATAGALAAGLPTAGWAKFGRRVGAAYQLADDLLDVTTASAAADKSPGRDALLGRPNYALRYGLQAAQAALCGHLNALSQQLRVLNAPTAAEAWFGTLAAKLQRLCLVEDVALPSARRQRLAHPGGAAVAFESLSG